MTDFPKRTERQSRSAHLWFSMIAEAWNQAGYEEKLTFGTIDTPWTKDSVKIMFKKIAYAMYQKKSTTELTTKELTEVGEVLNRGLADRGLHIPFPSLQELMINDENNANPNNQPTPPSKLRRTPTSGKSANSRHQKE